MEALIIGATGATGKELLQLLLAEERIRKVTVFVRHELPFTHPKLRIHVIDFDQPATWQDLVTADVLFSCLGTTLKDAGSKEAQWKVDHDYQLAFAQAARANSVYRYVLVSSDHASQDAFLFYSKMKGQLEQAVKALQFPSLIIFRPPMLIRSGSDRAGEQVGAKVLGFFNSIGLFRSARPLETKVLAQAMNKAAQTLGSGQYVFSGQEIRKFAPAPDK